MRNNEMNMKEQKDFFEDFYQGGLYFERVELTSRYIFKLDTSKWSKLALAAIYLFDGEL